MNSELVRFNRLQQSDNPDVKIFVIGFNKCGTSTFHNFFLENGIRSIHWRQGSQFVARTIRDLVLQGGDLTSYLRKATAFSDLTVIDAGEMIEANGYFREFHALFPQSFFMLNDRDPLAWLESRTNHQNASFGTFMSRAMTYYKATEDEVREIWLTQREDHYRDAGQFFSGNDRFLRYRIDQDHPEKIVEFLAPVFRLDAGAWTIKNKTL